MKNDTNVIIENLGPYLLIPADPDYQLVIIDEATTQLLIATYFKGMNDSLKDFCNYIDNKGVASTDNRRVYMAVAKSVNSAFGLTNRRDATLEILPHIGNAYKLGGLIMEYGQLKGLTRKKIKLLRKQTFKYCALMSETKMLVTWPNLMLELKL